MIGFNIKFKRIRASKYGVRVYSVQDACSESFHLFDARKKEWEHYSNFEDAEGRYKRLTKKWYGRVDYLCNRDKRNKQTYRWQKTESGRKSVNRTKRREYRKKSNEWRNKRHETTKKWIKEKLETDPVYAQKHREHRREYHRTYSTVVKYRKQFPDVEIYYDRDGDFYGVRPKWMLAKIANYAMKNGIDMAIEFYDLPPARRNELELFAGKNHITVTVGIYEYYQKNSFEKVVNKYDLSPKSAYKDAFSILCPNIGRPKHDLPDEIIGFYKNNTISETIKTFNLSKKEAKSLQNRFPKGMRRGGARPGAGRPRKEPNG